jgi:NTP pyrophosphatase (non-canonical NTP hydrolase)
MNIESLRRLLRIFVKERDWHRFHTSRNLAAQLSVEAGELLECYAWSEHGQSTRGNVKHELADVLIYLVMLADAEGVDLIGAALEKIAHNAARYPVEVSRGCADKAPGESNV